jgi:hypothetical protein
MKKKSLLLTWTRWTAAGIANLTMAISPLAMGKAQEARASALADFQKAYKEVGLGSGATVGEVWEKMRPNLGPDVQAMMDPIFRGQKVKFPKIDIIPFKDRDGQEKIRLLVHGVEKKQTPMTITIWGEDNKYIQFNDKIAKKSDAESVPQLMRAFGINIDGYFKAVAQNASAGSIKSAVIAQNNPARVFKSAAEIAKMDINKQLTYMVGMRRLYDAMEAVQRLAVKDSNYAKTKIIIPSSVPEEPQFTYIDWLLSVTQAMAAGGGTKKAEKPDAGGDSSDRMCVNGGWIGQFRKSDRNVCDTVGIQLEAEYKALLKACNGDRDVKQGKEKSRPCNPSLFGFGNSSSPICIDKKQAGEAWSEFSHSCAVASDTVPLANCLQSKSFTKLKLDQNCEKHAGKLVKSWMAANLSCKDLVDRVKMSVTTDGKLGVSGIPENSQCKLKELPEYENLLHPYRKLADYCYDVEKETAKTNQEIVNGDKEAPKASKAKKDPVVKACENNPESVKPGLKTGGKNPCNQILACDALKGRFFEIEPIEEEKPKKCADNEILKDGNCEKCPGNQVPNEAKTECVCTKGDNCKPTCPGGLNCPPLTVNKTECYIQSTGSWMSKIWEPTREQIDTQNNRIKISDGDCKAPTDSCSWAFDRGNPLFRANYVTVVDDKVKETIEPKDGSPNSGLQCGMWTIGALLASLCARQFLTTHTGFCGHRKSENPAAPVNTDSEGSTGTINTNKPAAAPQGGVQ